MIKKIKAKRRYKIDITYNVTILKHEIYIGENKRRWNPAIMGFVYKVVNNIHLIELGTFFSVLKRGMYVISEVIRNRARFVVAGNNRTNGRPLLKLMKKTKQAQIKTIYYAGGFTRRHENFRQFLEVRRGLTNMRVREKFMKQLVALKKLRAKPPIMVILDAFQGKYLIAECKKLGIASLGAGSTNLNLPNLTYKIIGNFASEQKRIFLLLLVYHAIFEGIRKETSLFATYNFDIKSVKKKIKKKIKNLNLIKKYKNLMLMYNLARVKQPKVIQKIEENIKKYNDAIENKKKKTKEFKLSDAFFNLLSLQDNDAVVEDLKKRKQKSKYEKK